MLDQTPDGNFQFEPDREKLGILHAHFQLNLFPWKGLQSVDLEMGGEARKAYLGPEPGAHEHAQDQQRQNNQVMLTIEQGNEEDGRYEELDQGDD